MSYYYVPTLFEAIIRGDRDDLSKFQPTSQLTLELHQVYTPDQNATLLPFPLISAIKN